MDSHRPKYLDYMYFNNFQRIVKGVTGKMADFEKQYRYFYSIICTIFGVIYVKSSVIILKK